MSERPSESSDRLDRHQDSTGPSPERARALRSLAALELGADLDFEGAVVCGPDDPDCAVPATLLTTSAAPAAPEVQDAPNTRTTRS